MSRFGSVQINNMNMIKTSLSKLRCLIKRGFIVDSGAADNVMPIGWILGMVISKSVGSIVGLMYMATNGS